MAKKPKIQSRTRNAPRSPQTPRSRGSKQVFYQCVGCGAIVDPMFGFDGDSWCPFCKQPGLNESREGRLPDPELYGRWLERQEKPTDAATPDEAQGTAVNTLPTKQGSTTMKQKKHHTGTYSCLNCCIEYELFYDEQLQCDRCKGPLVKGHLEDFEDDWEEAEDDDH